MQKQPLLHCLFLILLIGAAACSTGSGLRDVRIDDSNRAELAGRLATELSIEEGRLLEAYIARNHSDLEPGQLPVGATIGEMIAAQRTFENSRSAAEETPEPEPESEPEAESGNAPANVSADRSAPTSTTPQPRQPAKPAPLTVEAGTPLRIRLDQALSSKTATSGQSFAAHLDADLKVGDTVVAPRGSRVEGRVTDVAGSGRVKGRARMSLTLTAVEVGGEKFDLATHQLSFEAEKGTKDDALKIGIGAAAGAVIGAIAGGGSGAAKGTAIGAGAGTGAVLLTKGEEIEFAAEQAFQFRLREDVALPPAG